MEYSFIQEALLVDSNGARATLLLTTDRGRQMSCDAPATCRKSVLLSLGIQLNGTCGLEGRTYRLYVYRSSSGVWGLGLWARPGGPRGFPVQGVREVL